MVSTSGRVGGSLSGFGGLTDTGFSFRVPSGFTDSNLKGGRTVL